MTGQRRQGGGGVPKGTRKEKKRRRSRRSHVEQVTRIFICSKVIYGAEQARGDSKCNLTKGLWPGSGHSDKADQMDIYPVTALPACP